MTDLERLRELAEKATPGPWTVEPFGNPGEYEIGYGQPDEYGRRRRVVSCGEPAEADGIEPWDAAYIASVSPDILLALLDTLEREAGCCIDSCGDPTKYAGAYRLGDRKIILSFCVRHFDETNDAPLSPLISGLKPS